MKFSRSSLALLVLGAQSLCTSAFVSTPAKALSQRTPAALLSRGASVEAAAEPTSASATSDTGLLPEFEQALEMAKSKLISSIPAESKEKVAPMIPTMEHFMTEYMKAGQAAYLDGNKEDGNPKATVERVMGAIAYAMKFGLGEDKFVFDVSHEALRGDPEKEDENPIDFYKFGCDFFRPAMNLPKSQVLGKDNLKKVTAQLAAGENVVFFANHHSEADPQVCSVCLEEAGCPELGADMIYVAGHKVTTDAFAIPFSMGRNLICIHSKKHMNSEPSLKKVKQRQNLQAMSAMLNKMKKGGCALWVAPSGGRDRRDLETGEVPIAPFDSKTIDMFRLMGNKSKVPTHYYTLAMVSYELCPPPDFVEAGVGEQRNVRYSPVGIYMGDELESVGGLETRHEFCENAQEQCAKDNAELTKVIKEA